MMKLVIAPDPRLEQAVDPFDYNTTDPVSTSWAMTGLMLGSGGVGLAANQVGLNSSIFVFKPVINRAHSVDGVVTVINPVIMEASDRVFQETEGCLSYPGVFLRVSRPWQIWVSYETISQDLNEVVRVQTEYQDFDARCFMHEYDHLIGIQFIDRVSALQRSRSLTKLNKFKKRN
jgi:peptide deformylase